MIHVFVCHVSFTCYVFPREYVMFATCCNTHCNTLQHRLQHAATPNATHCNTDCNTLQHRLQHAATPTATRCNTNCNSDGNTDGNTECNAERNKNNKYGPERVVWPIAASGIARAHIAIHHHTRPAHQSAGETDIQNVCRD